MSKRDSLHACLIGLTLALGLAAILVTLIVFALTGGDR